MSVLVMDWMDCGQWMDWGQSKNQSFFYSDPNPLVETISFNVLVAGDCLSRDERLPYLNFLS